MHNLLTCYVRARNNRRSCTVAAQGFVSGRRIYALNAAIRQEQAALQAIAGWAEDRARAELGLPPTPGTRDAALPPITDLLKSASPMLK